MKSHLVYSFELKEGDKIFEDNEFTRVERVLIKPKTVTVTFTNGQVYRVDKQTSFNLVDEL